MQLQIQNLEDEDSDDGEDAKDIGRTQSLQGPVQLPTFVPELDDRGIEDDVHCSVCGDSEDADG